MIKYRLNNPDGSKNILSRGTTQSTKRKTIV